MKRALGSASLPMYYWPELAWAWDDLWRAVRNELAEIGIEAPLDLQDPPDPMVHWKAGDLVLSQTCGWPLVDALAGQVTVLGAFDFGPDIGPPGMYHSVLVARADDGCSSAELLRKGRFAFNSKRSLSGYQVLGLEGVDFGEATETGTHRESIRAVATGQADWAAIDAVCWRLALAHEPASAQLRVFDATRYLPGLPVIAGADRDPEPYRRAFKAGIESCPVDALAALGIRGFVPLNFKDYVCALR